MPRRNSKQRADVRGHTSSGKRTRHRPSSGLILFLEKNERYLRRRYVSRISREDESDGRLTPEILELESLHRPYGETSKKILHCACKSKAQDKRFGHGRRLHTRGHGMFVCTSCGERKRI